MATVGRSDPRRATGFPEVDLLALVLHCQPALPGALCRDRSSLFDSEDPDDVAEAVALCGRCPDLAQCRQWVGTLTTRNRPAGVVAGRLYRTVGYATTRVRSGSVVGA